MITASCPAGSYVKAVTASGAFDCAPLVAACTPKPPQGFSDGAPSFGDCGGDSGDCGN